MGGQALSNFYISNNTKYKWKCKEGHVWESTFASVSKNWCPECSGRKRITAEMVKEFVVSKNGFVLHIPDGFTANKKHFTWQCEKGHTWKATLGNIYYKNVWCPECAGKIKKNIEYVDSIVSPKNIRCLTREYTGVDGRYVFMCSKEHTWETSAQEIKKTGCPICTYRVSKPEIEIRHFLANRITNLFFNKTGILPNRRYELDIYAPDTMKAVEYNGERFHLTQQAIKRDMIKAEMCRDMGIDLLIVWDSIYRKQKEVELLKIFDFLKC